MAQKLQLNLALQEFQVQQDSREQQEATGRTRLAARQWWQRPASSNTMAWVHSGGARGTSSQDSRRWRHNPTDSILA